MRSNKFNIHWQIVRVLAKKEKDVFRKGEIVKDFYYACMNTHNLDRVNNWFTMTALGYKDVEKKAILLEMRDGLAPTDNEVDMSNNLDDVTIEELRMVQKDLSKRKNSFFHGGKAPKTQVAFMKVLDAYINAE